MALGQRSGDIATRSILAGAARRRNSFVRISLECVPGPGGPGTSIRSVGVVNGVARVALGSIRPRPNFWAGEADEGCFEPSSQQIARVVQACVPPGAPAPVDKVQALLSGGVAPRLMTPPFVD